MNKTRKILSIILSVIMILSVIPVASFAADGDFVIENGVLTKYQGAGGDVVIPDGVTSVGDSAFAYCDSVTSVEIPDGVTDIGYEAFYYCDSLASVTIPDGVTSIGDEAFYGCTSLASIEIPDSVISIDDDAFAYCYSLTSIQIPDSVTSIGNHILADCAGLTSITVDENNPVYDSRDNCNAIIETETNTLVCGCGSTTIPDSVTSIGNYAFWACRSLTSIEIPDNVTSIGSNAFYNCVNLTDVTIGNGVTIIDIYAFQGCDNLTNLTIGNSVKNIGYYTFSDCKNLKSVILPDSLIIIGTYAFFECESLESITIPGSVKTIGTYAFWYCDSLASVTIKNGVAKIGPHAFKNCGKLASVIIPASVTSIGDYAFGFSNSLTDVYYGGTEAQWNEIEIGKGNDPLLNANIHFTEAPDPCEFLEYEIVNGEVTITGCKDETLTELVIPSDIEGCPVTSIDNYAFENFTTLTSVTIPGSVKTIGEWAFRDCTALEDLTIENGVKSIVDGVFMSCTSLKNLVIPASVEEVGQYTFYDCTGLESITVDENNPVYDSRDNCNAIIETATNTLIKGTNTTIIPYGVEMLGACSFLNCDKLTTIAIPDSVEFIDGAAFSDCTALTEMVIPASVIGIAPEAFTGCTSLVSLVVDADNPVYDSRDNCNAIIDTMTDTLIYGCSTTVIPDSVTAIGYVSFGACSALKEIKIPDGVTSIGEGAFFGCTSLEKVELPESLTDIGDGAFIYDVNIKDIYVSWMKNIPAITYDTFGDENEDGVIYANAVLHVPEGTKARYEAADGWKYFENIVDDVPVESFVIENGVLIAYKGAGGNVVIPDGVTAIGDSAFFSCTDLTGVVIPDSVTSIGKYAFSYCENLSDINIPDGVTYIGEEAFNHCHDIVMDLVIPDGFTEIDRMAFAGCEGLTSVVIPDGVTKINDSAFFYCTGIKEATIPASVTSIGESAFGSCSSLTDVYFGGTEAQWNEINIMERNEALLNANIHFAELSAKDKAIAEIIASMGEDPSDAVKAAAEAAIAAINAAETDEEIAAAQKEGVKNVNNAKSEIVSVKEITEPTVGSYVTLEVLFTKSVQKLQFVDKNGNTITFSPTSLHTLNIVDNEDGSQTWTIEIKVYHQSDTYNLHAKNDLTGWSEKNFEYTIADKHEYKKEIESVEMPPEAFGNRITAGRHDITIKTGSDVTKVQIAFNGSTVTYTKSSTNASVTTEDGCLVWTINHNFSTIGNGLVYTVRTRTASTSFADAGTFTVDVLR